MNTLDTFLFLFVLNKKYLFFKCNPHSSTMLPTTQEPINLRNRELLLLKQQLQKKLESLQREYQLKLLRNNNKNGNNNNISSNNNTNSNSNSNNNVGNSANNSNSNIAPLLSQNTSCIWMAIDFYILSFSLLHFCIYFKVVEFAAKLLMYLIILYKPIYLYNQKRSWAV